MAEPDEFEDPALATVHPTGPTFWATVHWRLGFGAVVCALTGIAFFLLSLFNARDLLEIPMMTIGSAVGVAILWVFSRVLWAWVEWPSEFWLIRGLKAVIRFLLFDVESERRAAGDTIDRKGHSEGQS